MKSAMMRIMSALCVIGACCAVRAASGPAPAPDETVVYRKTPSGEELKLFVFRPRRSGVSVPAMVMFHGGGWRGGSPEQFFRQCRDWADCGYVAFSVSYRLSPPEKPQNTVFQAVEDARSAVRYLKKHAARFGVDPDRIITAGSSAGAHLAISTSVLKLDAPDDDLSIDPAPRAVILMCPVIDAGPPPGYGAVYRRIPDRWREFSPIHNLHRSMPPQLLLLGDRDAVLSVEHAREYRRQVMDKGCRCDLEIFPGARHAAFYRGKYYEASRPVIVRFLHDLRLEPSPGGDR